MGVPLGYMDFAPEPPTATPVISTELNCTPSNDTKDLSSEYLSSIYDTLIINPLDKKEE